MELTYKIERNKKFGDYRIVKYIDGKWDNEFDGMWTKYKAEKILRNKFFILSKMDDPKMKIKGNTITFLN
jgi:hypothetical protein